MKMGFGLAAAGIVLSIALVSGCGSKEPAPVPVQTKPQEKAPLPELAQNKLFLTNRPDAQVKKDTSFQDMPDEMESVSEADRRLMEKAVD